LINLLISSFLGEASGAKEIVVGGRSMLAVDFVTAKLSSTYDAATVSDFQPPNRFRLIREIPASATAVAADLLKEWPVKGVGSSFKNLAIFFAIVAI
jgi:hypothetical protein